MKKLLFLSFFFSLIAFGFFLSFPKSANATLCPPDNHYCAASYCSGCTFYSFSHCGTSGCFWNTGYVTNTCGAGCVPTPTPVPSCNLGTCGACSVSCGGGTKLCTYTTYSGGGSCTQNSGYQSCNTQSCSSTPTPTPTPPSGPVTCSGVICGGGQCSAAPDCRRASNPYCNVGGTCSYIWTADSSCPGCGGTATPTPTPAGIWCYAGCGASCTLYCGSVGCSTSCAACPTTPPAPTPTPTPQPTGVPGSYICSGTACVPAGGGPYPDSTCSGICASNTHVIFGHVYRDLNNNNQFDPGEGYNGATINEYSGATLRNSGNTANWGSFMNWYDGAYEILLYSDATSVQAVPSSIVGYTIISQNPVPITATFVDNIVNWQITPVAATPTPVPTSPAGNAISGDVFVDTNKNQLLDSGESGYSGGASTISIYQGSQVSGTPYQTIETRNGIFTTGNVLPAGTYTVSYAGRPTGYQMTVPINGPPPQFTVTVGTGCSVGSSNSASCDAGNSIINLNFGITNSKPWCQFAGGGNTGGDGGFTCNCTDSSCIIPSPSPTSVPTPTPPTCNISGQSPCYSCSGTTCTVSCASSCGTTCNASCGGTNPPPSPTPTPPTCTSGLSACYSCSGATCTVSCASSCGTICDASCGSGTTPTPTPTTGGGGSGSTCIYDVDCVIGLTCNTSGSTCTCSVGSTPGTCTTGAGGAGGVGTGGSGSTCIYDVDCSGGLTCNTSGSTCTCSVGSTPGTCTTGAGGAGGGRGGSGIIGNTGGTGGFNDIIPDPSTVNSPSGCGGAYASIPGTTSTTPGLIFTGNGSAYFGQGSASLNSWLVGGTNYPESFGPIAQGGVVKTSYAYLQSIAKQAGITPVDLNSDASFCSFGGLTNCRLSSSLPHGIYIAKDNLTLTGSGTPASYRFPLNQGYIILVQGSLTIKTELLVPVGSTALFSASGNILVDQSVGEADYKTVCTPSTVSGGFSTGCDIEGVFSADQNFVINGQNDCTIGPDVKLNVAGSIITNAALSGGTFINQRDLCQNNLYCPVFTVQSRPDFILNAPNFIKKANSTWQEVAP